MKIAILIVSFNRPQYLKETLWSIRNADLSKVNQVLIVDNNSTDSETNEILADCEYKVMKRAENAGISINLMVGYEHLFQDHDMVINFDSDAVIRPDFITRLLELYQPEKLLTGFHSTTKNANGTDRHIITSEHDGYCIKESVGGINFVVDRYCYINYVKPALEATIPHGNFDHISCLNAGGVMCAVPSLVQHIGFESSLNHHENPDVADDFYYYDLPNVTLLGVDCNKERLDKAKNKCTKWIRFGRIVTINPPLTSKEEYSTFMIKEAYKYIETSHVLIFQHDGFVHNWKVWDNAWLEYDYIGAPWWYTDGMSVGNGGFSLRSKRLMEIIAIDTGIISHHPEDHVICRVYRKYLENKYGIKFAPLEVAEKFAFEGYRQPTKVLDQQFGVHGPNPRTVTQAIKSDRLVFNQFLSLGDILFMIPMYRALVDEGNSVLWPIDPMYLSIAKHFPDIQFVDKTQFDLPYDNSYPTPTQYGLLLPYRFASEIQGLTLKNCMDAKYSLYGHNYLMWRELIWKRDYDNEALLIKFLDLPEKFNLVNRFYGHLATHQITPEIDNGLPIVEMRNISGFTLIDWTGVVELANELHIANSSLNYLLELMTLDKQVHIYKRNMWGEIGFEYTRHLFTNKDFIYHE